MRKRFPAGSSNVVFRRGRLRKRLRGRLRLCLRARPGLSPYRVLALWAIVLGTVLAPFTVVGGEPAVILYVEGDVLIRAGSVPVEIGMRLQETEILDLGPGGYAELDSAGRTIRLVGPGEYRLDTLAQSPVGQSGFSAALGRRVQRVLADERRGDLAAAGVRGDFGGEDTWDAPGPARDLHNAAVEALRGGRASEAEILLQEALLYAGTNEAAVIRIELTELYLGEERIPDALNAINAVPLPSRTSDDTDTGEWLERFYRARGSALHAAGLLRETVDLVHRSRHGDLPGETQLHLELLAADAAVRTGDRSAAVEALSRIVELAPDTAWATASRRMLEGLD